MSKLGNFEDKPFLAELYDLVLAPRYAGRCDLDFYVELCRETGGRVLELGCGTGRVLTAVAAAGIDTVGLDISASMIARCRQNLASQPQSVRDRIRLVQASMIDFDLGERFAAVIIPLRPFQHLVEMAEQIACLSCVHRHLRPGGVLAFDLFQVDYNKINDPRRTEEVEDLPEFTLADGRKIRLCSRIVATHRAQQYNDVEIIFYLTHPDGRQDRLVQGFPFRYFFRYEVEHLLARTGYDLVATYGDFDKSAPRDESPEMIFVARKAG